MPFDPLVHKPSNYTAPDVDYDVALNVEAIQDEETAKLNKVFQSGTLKTKKKKKMNLFDNFSDDDHEEEDGKDKGGLFDDDDDFAPVVTFPTKNNTKNETNQNTNKGEGKLEGELGVEKEANVAPEEAPEKQPGAREAKATLEAKPEPEQESDRENREQRSLFESYEFGNSGSSSVDDNDGQTAVVDSDLFSMFESTSLENINATGGTEGGEFDFNAYINDNSSGDGGGLFG